MKLTLTKKTKIIQGKQGYTLEPLPDGSINVNAVISVGLNTPIDIRAATSVNLNPTTYTEIFKYVLPAFPVKLQEVMVCFSGMSSHFILEFFDGATTTNIREYWLSIHSNPFVERFGSEIVVPNSTGAYLRFMAKLNGAGQDGVGYAALNGYR